MEQLPAPEEAPARRTPVADRVHRVHWFTGRLGEVLDEVLPSSGALGLAALDAEQTAEALGELAAARARLDALELALLGHADRVDVAALTGATSTGAWWAHTATRPVTTANRQVSLARRLDGEHEATRTALAAGAVDAEQAAVVVAAVQALPGFVPEADRRRAEAHLLGLAGEHDARRLRLLGRHLLEVVDPEGAEEHLARQLEAQERRAAQRTFLQLFDGGDGTCTGRFRIPTLHGDLLRVALDALASPTRPHPIPRQVPDDTSQLDPNSEPSGDTNGDASGNASGLRDLTRPEVLGQAFCELLERYPAKRLPRAGGTPVNVVVTMTLQTLLTGLGTATLDTGHRITAAEARRLACQAGIIPAVLGTDSEVLDLGRRTRLHTPAMRLALKLRDRGCTTLGCDRPAAWCQADHIHPRAAGGPTSVANGRLLCTRHHTLHHHPGYQTHDAGGGTIRFTRLRR